MGCCRALGANAERVDSEVAGPVVAETEQVDDRSFRRVPADREPASKAVLGAADMKGLGVVDQLVESVAAQPVLCEILVAQEVGQRRAEPAAGG